MKKSENVHRRHISSYVLEPHMKMGVLKVEVQVHFQYPHLFYLIASLFFILSTTVIRLKVLWHM